MSFHNLSISVLKVGRQLAGSLAVAAFSFLGISGCIKEESPITPHDPGDVLTRTINLSPDYRFQVFYSLERDSVLSSNLKTDWDIAFDARTEGSIVYLNSSKFMGAWNTKRADFDKITDTTVFSDTDKWTLQIFLIP